MINIFNFGDDVIENFDKDVKRDMIVYLFHECLFKIENEKI